jgi:hypothetical protein
MSATKRSMLSSTHAIFRGLQESLRESLRTLPDNTPPRLKLGLTRAHRKLSDYYGKTDDSPYYTWSSRTRSVFCIKLLLTCLIAVLDPRIGYEGLLADCGDDVSMRNSLENSRERLKTYYRTHYAPEPSSETNATQSAPSVASGSPQKVDFMARYKKQARVLVDEIEEFFKLPQEAFDNCDPIQWWAGRRAQFPNLSRLARDIISIPGMYQSAPFR